MKVTVLFGGPGDERPISLISGRAVIAGLQSMGHEVFASDISPEDLSGLDRPADVIFPVLHGQFGENGELQAILERRGLAFVGSGSAASRLGMDKALTKTCWSEAGLPTPAWRIVAASDPQARAADAFPQANGRFSPCVVKAVDSGSSIDVHLCPTPSAATEAVRAVLARHDRVMIEQYVVGPELTVGLLEESPLPPIRIIPRGAFFDHAAKYTAGDTEHRFDTGLPDDLVDRIRDLARRANAVVGARDLGRVDVMVDGKSLDPYLLEINTIPGFTPRSLLPEAAGHAGIGFGQLVDRLVHRARQRHREVQAA